MRLMIVRRCLLILILSIVIGRVTPPSAVAQSCGADGDVNQDKAVTPVDALLAWQHFLGLAAPPLNDCQQEKANVAEPQAGLITPADARCILRHFLQIPSCLDPPPATVQGRLIVPSQHMLEVEPNETSSQAQVLVAPATAAGMATRGDPGFVLRLPDRFAIILEDLYRITTSEKTRILLTIAEDDLANNDLDLLLLDREGNVIEVSEGLVATEVFETPGAGEFLIGIRAFVGGSPYVLSISSVGGISALQTAIIPAGAAFVPGEILVKPQAATATGVRQQATTLASAYGLAKMMSFPQGVDLMGVAPTQQVLPQGALGTKLRLPGHEKNALQALTIDTIRRLRRDPEIAYAEPNFLVHPTRLPNDEFFPLQWHYELINLPEAWDRTIGSAAHRIAVIDTGVLVDHADLRDRLEPGFDFISNPTQARDGDGIDPDPNDPGDDPGGASSSFHGTHVAGTLGATTDNSVGVAGVTWQTRLMPIRVLGAGGGTVADIAQAIRYAAGLANSSGALPAERADIINMSLGGPGFSQTLQDAILAARNEGVIIVAAAGNDNSSGLFFPAGLQGVLSVAAVDLNSNKASYSNFGPTVDVAAPGGNTGIDLNNDGFGDGVLSTLGTDQGETIYRFYQGTSMAAPHVAGVIALMLAVNPSLTPDDIDHLLAGTHANTALRITRDLGLPGRDDVFGHGLIDAAAAVLAAGDIVADPPPPAGAVLAVSTTALNFDNFLSALSFEITNAGSGMVAVTDIVADVPWLTLTPASGPAPLFITVTVDRPGLPEGENIATIRVVSDATVGSPTATVAVTVQVGGETSGNIGVVTVRVLDQQTLETVAEVETDVAQGYAYTLPSLAPGTYLLVAGTDRDRDAQKTICEIEDACGFFPTTLTLAPGQAVSGIDFVVGELASPQSTSTTFGGRHRMSLHYPDGQKAINYPLKLKRDL